ncbi:MAG: hypothetical protein U1F42_01715 [Candidatus Competibacteraceae bacterium]
MEPSARNNSLRIVAWLPIPLLLFGIVILWVVDPPATIYEPPYLLLGLNLLFSLPVSLFVAFQAGRGFLLRGTSGLLWFGCGMLFWGSAGPIGGALLSYGPNVVITIHNVLIWLAAACHLAGMVFSPRQWTTVQELNLGLTGAYSSTFAVVIAVTLATLSGEMPAFFIQGEGGTPLRQIVLGSAITMFVSTSALKRNSHATSSAFQHWYALGLLLIAIGLFSVMLQSAFGSVLSWTGRIAQYLGSAYLLAAAIIAVRETRDWVTPLEAALGETRQQFKEMFDLAADGIVVHELLDATGRGNFLKPTRPSARCWATPRKCKPDTPRHYGPGRSSVCSRGYGGIAPRQLTASRENPADQEWPTHPGGDQHAAIPPAKPHDGAVDDPRCRERKQAEEQSVRASNSSRLSWMPRKLLMSAVLDREGNIIAVNGPWHTFALANSGNWSVGPTHGHRRQLSGHLPYGLRRVG